MPTMTLAPTGAPAGAAPMCSRAPELMFPLDESERPGERTPGEARALRVCAACPVLAACRRAVLESADSAPLAYGVAGGMTREDRRAVRAAGRRPVPTTLRSTSVSAVSVSVVTGSGSGCEAA